MVCKNSSIVINQGVDALIGLNEMQINELPIELINNNSYVFENTLQKSHDQGIRIKCTSNGEDNIQACPII